MPQLRSSLSVAHQFSGSFIWRLIINTDAAFEKLATSLGLPSAKELPSLGEDSSSVLKYHSELCTIYPKFNNYNAF